jgi:hypothetical protein
MRNLLCFLLLLASTASSANITLLPGSTPQETPAGTPFPNPIAVLLTDASGAPVPGTAVAFYMGLLDGPVMDADNRAFDCIIDLGLTCQAITDSHGIAILPGFYGNGVHDYHVSILSNGTYTLTLTTTPSSKPSFKSLKDMWWSGPAENGWGMSVVGHGAQLFNVIYAYDGGGKPTWWVMPTGSWNAGFLSSYAGDVYSPRSSPYFAYDPSRWVAGGVAGRVSLSFNGADAAALSGTFGTATVQKSIVRMDNISSDGSSFNHGVGDMWWGGESQNGWGVAITERDGALFAVWLTYDADGMPTWFVMPGGAWTDAITYSGSLVRTSGSPWVGVPYDASQAKVAASGTYSLHFADPHHATLAYSIDGRAGTLPLVRQPF